ncbi:hypothetical protein AMECASPLE_029860 [Ameca splendens]|uniref:Serine/threonine-protein phosphatase 4 regulatory subunit 4 n=1 Tax=Ameca splendens TaxID=208324 RepID=A0ABV0Z4X7_9TELE
MFPGRMTLSPPGPPCGPPEELQELAFIERPIRRSLKVGVIETVCSHMTEELSTCVRNEEYDESGGDDNDDDDDDGTCWVKLQEAEGNPRCAQSDAVCRSVWRRRDSDGHTGRLQDLLSALSQQNQDSISQSHHQTAEEIDQLTVDEDLNDVERAVYLLSVGQEVQRASVISNLPSLVRQNPAETFRRVVPKVREVLNGAGAEIQLAAATSFLTILQDDIILIHTHTYSILKTVLLHLNHRDAVVSSAWLETLLSAINALPKETIKQEVLNPLLYQSQLSHSLQARLAACRILGKASCKFDSLIVKKELLPLARSLCRDVESEVRVCMCHHLDSMARTIGVDDTRAELLPELLELAGDEESSVRLAAFDSIISLMEMMDGDDRLHLLVPLVMSACDASSQVDEGVMVSLSFQFGKLCSGLAGSLSDEQKRLLLQKFQVLCITGLPTEENRMDVSESTLIRCNCCYNLPAMVAFVDPSHFLSDLYPPFSSLCSDPEVSVRRSVAASFHQVVKLLGSNVHVIHKELLLLLQDSALEVLDALMNHLDETLEVVLSRGDNLMLDNKLPELLSALLSAEQQVGSSLRWRLHEKLLHRYSCLSRLLPGELLHQTFSARIFIILTTNKVLPVQKEAARTFCTFLRYNRKQEQRQEMMERLIQDLAQGRSYWNRLRFLDVCEIATEIFSRKYFNKHFLIPALELVHDPVANVRYKLCQLLPWLRSSLRLPADKLLLQKLDFCVQKFLCREKDKDVVAMIRKTVLELDKLDLSEPFHMRHEWDLLDQKKEKEEMLLLEMVSLKLTVCLYLTGFMDMCSVVRNSWSGSRMMESSALTNTWKENEGTVKPVCPLQSPCLCRRQQEAHPPVKR